MKNALRDQLVAPLRADLEILDRAQASAREAATHEEAKPENDKGTCGFRRATWAAG